MNDQQAGRLLRELRHRRRWRQIDLAGRAGLSQSTESEAELGRLDGLTLGSIRRLFATCDASVVLDVRWRGGEVDRLLDRVHSELVREVGAYLTRERWTCWFEVTYSQFGERGSIDVLAVRGDAVLVVEVKSELTSIEATLRKLDEKARLAAKIAFERTGRRPWSWGGCSFCRTRRRHGAVSPRTQRSSMARCPAAVRSSAPGCASPRGRSRGSGLHHRPLPPVLVRVPSPGGGGFADLRRFLRRRSGHPPLPAVPDWRAAANAESSGM